MSKEEYFTPQSLSQRALEMLAAVKDLRGRHANISFKPERAALLVLDMQAYFLRQDAHAFIPSAPAIVPGIQTLIEAFTVCHRPVIFTRHLNSPQNAALMATWWQDSISKDCPWGEVIPELDLSRGCVLIKSQYDAFFQTSLEDTLRTGSANQVVICGVMTHLCCETTARSAFVRGFEVFFTIDGTATYTEAFHRASLLNLAHGFAVPVLVAEILSGFRNYEG